MSRVRRRVAEEVLVIVEQRCRLTGDGEMLGAVGLGALDGLPQRVPVHVLAREGTAPQSTVVLVGARGTIVRWSSPREIMSTIRRLAAEVRRSGAVVVYAPGSIGTLAALCALALGKPLAVVAVGDPAEALRPPVTTGARGHVLRFVMPAAMRAICRRAAVVRYVTAHVLQSRYPAGSLEIAASDARSLRGHDEVDRARRRRSGRPARTIVTVASLDQPYKGVAELICAVGQVQAAGVPADLVIVGEGRLRPSLETFAAKTLTKGSCTFTGHLRAAELAATLDASDVFVLASWSEGMPRALVEAMESGIPCIGTRVGGIVELLPESALVPTRNPAELARALMGALTQADWRESAATANATRAAEVIAAGSVGHDDFLDVVADLPSQGQWR